VRKMGQIAAFLIAATWATTLAAQTHSDSPAASPTRPAEATTVEDSSWRDALTRLRAGNDRFAADALEGRPVGRDRRLALATGQSPFAIVLSCADSRVPPEIVFNAGLGDLFVVRAAGQVADHSVLASIEYAAEHLHTPMLVVMGHELCGAVKASLEPHGSLGPNLDFLVKAITPAVERAAAAPGRDRLHAAVVANVEQVVNDVLGRSAIVRQIVEHQQLHVVGAVYGLETGRVIFTEPVNLEPARTAHR